MSTLAAVAVSDRVALAQVSAGVDGANRLMISGSEQRDVVYVLPGKTNIGREIVINGSGESTRSSGCEPVRVESKSEPGFDWELSCANPTRIVATLRGGEDEIAFGRRIDVGAEVNGGPGADIIYGTNKVDQLMGGIASDMIWGFDEGDGIKGGDHLSNDTTGDEKDFLFGGDGNDVIGGDRGDDVIDGQDDNDGINGDAGRDSLTGGPGTDQLVGGSDSDFLFARDGERDFLYCGHTGASLPDGTLEPISDGVPNSFAIDSDLDVPQIDFVREFDCTDELP